MDGYTDASASLAGVNPTTSATSSLDGYTVASAPPSSNTRSDTHTPTLHTATHAVGGDPQATGPPRAHEEPALTSLTSLGEATDAVTPEPLNSAEIDAYLDAGQTLLSSGGGSGEDPLTCARRDPPAVAELTTASSRMLIETLDNDELGLLVGDFSASASAPDDPPPPLHDWNQCLQEVCCAC
jgi:hypothetical protein